ncbi:type II toxin-antitoxin system RelE/ParE family toxin [Candidatus Woesearchaeota archaeon]|nr:MAG: type II toxin-antitoxin system RelE/ParE family toxin [Candidatus Woesearchaeota archaeon]
MTYAIAYNPYCQKQIAKASSKNPVLENIIRNKIQELSQNPLHYKPLKYALKGERRVHILKSFVLIFSVDENAKTIVLLSFEHHDNAYRR